MITDMRYYTTYGPPPSTATLAPYCSCCGLPLEFAIYCKSVIWAQASLCKRWEKAEDCGRLSLTSPSIPRRVCNRTYVRIGNVRMSAAGYWEADGSRAQFKHGRAFDVWAVGCIVIELAILIVSDWQSGMLTKVKDERKKNPKRDRKSSGSGQEGSDVSFYHNSIVVRDWVS